jgi:hypothetical protein
MIVLGPNPDSAARTPLGIHGQIQRSCNGEPIAAQIVTAILTPRAATNHVPDKRRNRTFENSRKTTASCSQEPYTASHLPSFWVNILRIALAIFCSVRFFTNTMGSPKK